MLSFNNFQHTVKKKIVHDNVLSYTFIILNKNKK